MKSMMLILDVNGKKAEALIMSRSGKKLKLLSVHQSSISEGRLDDEFLRFISGKKFSSGVYLLLPSEESVIKIITVNLTAEEKIARVIKFEAEKFLPYPADEAVLDFRIVKKGKDFSEVLFTAIRRERLEFYLDLFKDSGLTLAACSPDILAAAELAAGDEPFMLIDSSPARVNLAVFSEGAPVLLKVVRVDENTTGREPGIKDIIAEEALVLSGLFGLKEPGRALQKAYITGDCAGIGDLAFLADKAGLDAEAMNAPKITFSAPAGDKLKSTRGVFDAALGMGLAVVRGRKIINLKDVPGKPRKHESLILSAILAGVICALILSSVYLRLKSKERALSAINKEISTVLEEGFSAPELAGRSGMEIISILGERTGVRGEALSALDGAGMENVLDFLLELVTKLPEGGGYEVSGVYIDRNICYLDGRASSFMKTQEIFNSLLSSPYFRDVRIGRAQADSEKGGVVFRIEIVPPGGGGI